MSATNLVPSSFVNDPDAQTNVYYPIDDDAIDKMTRSVLGVAHHLIATSVERDRHQVAELMNAYTHLYTVYLQNKRHCLDESEAEPNV